MNAAAAGLQFLQSPSCPLLYAASDDGTVPPPGSVRRGFLLPPGAQGGAILTLAQTWAMPGTYLFLEQPLAAGGETAFAIAAWNLLGQPSFSTPRIAWFDSGVPANGQLNGYVLAMAQGGLRTSRTLYLPYRNYALTVGVGTAFGLDPAQPGFTLSQNAGAIAFSCGFGASALGGTGPVSIALQGEHAGSLQFQLALGATGGVPDLALLDVGMRTYYPTADSGTDDATLLSSLRYPLFDVAQTPTLQATLAPWSVAEERSFFAFAAATGALTSCYAGVTGHALTLAPLQDTSGPTATPARLVLAARPSAFPASSDDLYTLIPKGDFLVAASGQPQARAPSAATVMATAAGSRFMCGLSGVEYIGLAAANALSFFSGAPAFADGFDPTAANAAPTRLTAGATTSWALPCAWLAGEAAALSYFAQPDGAVLYQPSNAGALAPLVYLEVGANTLPAAVTAANAIPLLPYAGIDGQDLAACRTLETRVISPLRRATIAARGSAPAAAAWRAQPGLAASASTGLGSVTPQGLLAQFADPTLHTIESLVIAQMADGSRFALHTIANGDPLRTALASNQLLLVMSNPAAIAPYLSPDPAQREIAIQDWRFALDADQWTPATTPPALHTAMIWKFARGALADLINDPRSWAQARVAGAPAPVPFNLDDGAASARIGAQIADAIAQFDNGRGDIDFAVFVTAVTDPNWQGILFLNVSTPLAQLPQQCKGLAAGIDPSLFRAHHLAIEISKIDASVTPLTLRPSSMFGLVDYNAPVTPLRASGAPYQFQVDSLKVRFLNSAIVSFASKVELMVRQLFGDAVDQAPADSILYLFGALQRQTVAGVVHDTYLFRTAQNQPKVFPIVAGNVFNAIEVGSAQFVTEFDSANDGLTHTYFALAGLLDFAALEMDVFSFGRSGGDAPAGLRFSKLMIRMAFAPDQQDSARFAFDAGGMAFDLAISVARPDSLYQHFPLSLAALLQADSVSTPGGAGYLGLQSALTQSDLAYPWYGLVFDLDLGTLGALAAKAGFIAQFIAAWSPAAGNYQVFVGLKLPGSDGGKDTISIEGVLDLGFRALVLGQNGASTYYLLLNALALKFLGISFPTGGQIDMALFGNPDDQHNSSLGWYAAYTKDQAQKPAGAKDRLAHAALRQTALRALGGPQGDAT